MTLTVINGMATAALTEVAESPKTRRAHMLSRRVNGVDASVIESEASEDASTAQMFARRNHAAQTGLSPVVGLSEGGIKGGGLRRQE